MTSHTSIKLAKPDKILNNYLLRSFAPTKNTIEPPPAPTFPPRSIEPTVQNKPEPPSKRQKGAKMESKTPRTKSEAIKYLAGLGHLACDRIEELETELAEARAEIGQLKQLWSCNLDIIGGELNKQLAEARADADHWKSECNALQRMVHEARAVIEHKNRLIEQMREALRLTADEYSLHVSRYENRNAHDDPCYIAAEQALAAERGE